MRTLTIFRAYKQAESYKEQAVSCRRYYDFKDSFGIGVQKDKYALEWQKRDRQSRYFEERLLERLK